MADISPRRRWAGRAVLAGGLLTLPLTASVTYAAPSMQAREPDRPGATQAAQEAEPIVDVDPDQAQPIRRNAADPAEAAERLATEARALAERARAWALVFEKDGEISTEREVEERVARLDRQMEDLRARGIDDFDVKIDLGEVRLLDPDHKPDLERIRDLAARFEAEFSSLEGKRRLQLLQERALRLAEVRRPAMMDVLRDFEGQRFILTCKRDDNIVPCTESLLLEHNRATIVEARKAIETNRAISAEDRQRALRALDRAIPRQHLNP